MKFLRTLDSAMGTRKMYLGCRALRRHCAVRIRGTCTPKNTIAKTRYLGAVLMHPRTFRTRSSPDTALPRPPLNRITSNRCRHPRTDLLQVRDQKFSKSDFRVPRNFSEKVNLCPKRVFLTFRGTFGPQGGPTRTGECFHSNRHRVLHNFMCSVVT